MHYAVQHTTRYQYDTPIVENIMEVRLQPRSDETQHCLIFHFYRPPPAGFPPFRAPPKTGVFFSDFPPPKKKLPTPANPLVNVIAPPLLPDMLPIESWAEVDEL